MNKLTLTLALAANLSWAQEEQAEAPADETVAQAERSDTAETSETDEPIDEADADVVVVTSGLREQRLAIDVPSSITVLEEKDIVDEGGAQFEDIMYAVPNLNWSGATSRPRYFQIRGIGDQEEFQGAPNASVGFLIDDIDLSGLGMAATLWDVQQVEVLRGPQGTRYGANALAGLIYVKSNDPTREFQAGGQASLGTDNAWTMGAYASGPVTKDKRLLYRASLQMHNQDGFRENTYLGVSDTNARDERTGRFKLRWTPVDALRIDLTYMHANLANGYDAWTLDNNGFETITDQPGIDSARTNAGAMKLSWWMGDVARLTSLTTVGQTLHQHAFDGDWANPDYWAEKTCQNWETGEDEPCQYDYWWDKQADRFTVSQELRITSEEGGRLFADTTEWLAGFYMLHNQEHNDLESFYNGFEDVFLISDYKATNLAGFADLDSRIGPVALSAGVRVEHRLSEYEDDAGEAFDPNETMWGGHVTFTGFIGDHSRPYVRAARGYKAGGFNMGLPEVLSEHKTFGSEVLYNFEAGYKGYWLGGDLTTNAAVFYMDRINQQVEASVQDPDSPQNFFLYTNNAGRSNSFGGEFEIHARPLGWMELDGALGLLHAEYKDYSFENGDGTSTDLDGRGLAHAPTWNFFAAATFRAPFGLFGRVSVSGMDRFYYSDSHDFQSDAWAKVNLKVGYEGRNWGLYAWARNVFDARYGVRGFYFGNDPSEGWAANQYVRYGDPQQFGVTGRIDFN